MIYLLIIMLSIAVLIKLNRMKKGGKNPPPKQQVSPPDTTDRIKNIDEILSHVNCMLDFECDPNKILKLLKEKDKLIKEKEKIKNDSKN